MSKTNPHTADAAVLVSNGLSRAQSQGAALLAALAIVVFVVARLLDPADGLIATALPVSLLLAAGVGALHAMPTLGYARATFGLPNAITLLRLALVCSLSAAFFLDQPLTQAGPFLFGIAGLALCLDGLDGWLARRQGSQTAFGARFDMEVDAGLACMLSLILIADGRVGAAVLILGFSRYAFVVAALIWPWLRRPLPERMGRKIVCVIQVATLCLLLLPALPPSLANALALCAAAMLLWSFGRDIVYLARHR